MCLILFAYKVNPAYPLILAANRDEYYHRPALSAHWWPEKPYLLAGKDLVGGGTWMGITATGRIAAVTNVREPQVQHDSTLCSRGMLPLDYLGSRVHDGEFVCGLHESRSRYRGYNLIFGSQDGLFYYSNRQSTVRRLEPGIYGLSNAELDTPWPKVRQGKTLLATAVATAEPEAETLLDLLSDASTARDCELPRTGVSLEQERLLSATLIRGDQYGTRSSSVLLIDNHRQATLVEKERAPEEGPVNRFRFSIEPAG